MVLPLDDKGKGRKVRAIFKMSDKETTWKDAMQCVVHHMEMVDLSKEGLSYAEMQELNALLEGYKEALK